VFGVGKNITPKMITSRSLILSAAVAAVQAAQPGAVEPVAAPMRNLTWGQLNFLHTTDTHGWLGGHFQELVRSMQCMIVF
jgi:2',3'-cyclic-nucleotide 2'-phosphodiesterase (5'-nucleotidase family)